MSVSGQSARALLVAMALACPAGAAAQLSTVGGPFAAAIGGSAYARTADVGHDTAHNVFLLATSEHQTGRVFGSFSNGDGALVQGGFRIDSTANFAFGPAIAYSAQADAFLVLWVNDAAQVRGRLVRYGAGALGSADFLVATGARKTWAPAIAYSPTSQEFLVSWSSSAGPNWILRVSTSGAPIGSPIQVTGNVWTQEPALAWNAANNEFMLAYAQEINPGWQVRVQRVSQGQAAGGPVTVHSAGSTKMPDIAFSTQSGKFLVCWFQGSPYGIYSRLINQDGSAAAAVQPLLPSSYGSYDANSLSYNAFTGTFAVASITIQNSLDTIGGAPVSSLGVPGTAARWVEAPAGTGNRRYPEIAAGNANGRFVTIFNKSQNSFYGQALNSGATSSGGGTPLPPPPPPPPPPPEEPWTTISAAEGDFTGDSAPDLVWQRSDGLISIWRMAGLSAAGTAYVGPGGLDANWKVVGTGDLDGNGRPEIVWRHSTGLMCAWFLSNQVLQQAVYFNPPQVLPEWKIVAVADFNGDSRADLVWQHDQGYLAVWYMNGVSATGSELLNPSSIAGNDWKIVGAGDMNGDQKPDLIWRRSSTGAISAWLMNGRSLSQIALVSPAAVGMEWTIGAVVDLNNDGNSDLVWQRNDGVVAAWLMQGTTAKSTHLLQPSVVSTAWRMAGPR